MEEIASARLPDPTDALNRLLRILCRSFVVFLTETGPQSLRSSEKFQALAAIAEDQLRLARRVAEMIAEHHGEVDRGQFPAEFTSKHDLDAGFLLRQAVEYQVRDVAAIEQCSEELRRVPFAYSLAVEILGNARGHLENLQEMAKEP